MPDGPIGEIVEAGTMAFVAQCLEVPRQIVPRLYDPPPLGAFVKILSPAPAAPKFGGTGEEPHPASPYAREAGGLYEEEDPFAAPSNSFNAVSRETPLPAATYALVYGANTTSLEPSRRPSALGFADEEEMRLEQPQIFELLRTEFSGLLIAYAPGEGKALRRHLPPRPPRIHSRVYACPPEEVHVLTEELSFLRRLLLPSGGVLSSVPTDELVSACLRGAREVQQNDQEFLKRASRTLAMLLADDYERLQAILRAVI